MTPNKQTNKGIPHCVQDDDVKRDAVLPDADAVVWGEVELVGGFDVEAGVPAVLIANGEGAVLGGGVGIGQDALAEGGVADDASPVLSEGDEELLVAGEVIDFGCFSAFE